MTMTCTENNKSLLDLNDLAIINNALKQGLDVSIQPTRTGYRIVSKKVKVLKQIK